VPTRNEKGRIFDGFISGSVYDALATLVGFGPRLYERACDEIPLQPGMRVLDLGCGTGAMAFPMAKRVGDSGKVIGVDLSSSQLERGRSKSERLGADIEWMLCSVDELPFEDRSFDAVVSAMSFHEVARESVPGALAETRRVLRDDGFFALVDWSRPRFGLLTALWWPFLLFDYTSDNYQNRYAEMSSRSGLGLAKDVYLNSMVRCQVFRPEPSADGA